MKNVELRVSGDIGGVFAAQNIPHLFHKIAEACAELQKMAKKAFGRINSGKHL